MAWKKKTFANDPNFRFYSFYSHPQKPKWRIQHDELRENIRNAREITKAVKEGKPVPPPTKPAGTAICEVGANSLVVFIVGKMDCCASFGNYCVNSISKY